jgi:MFS transporter, MHS family, shikimate and dehydroshikimate transport protein
MPELFSARVRYSISVGFQVGAAIGGGVTPVIATALAGRAGATWRVSLFLAVLGVVTFAAVLETHETCGASLS